MNKYMKASGGIILEDGAVMVPSQIVETLNKLTHRVEELEAGAIAAHSYLKGKMTRSKIPDGVTRAVNAVTGDAVAVGTESVSASDYMDAAQAIENIFGASQYCDCQSFEIAKHWRDKTHGGQLALNATPTPPASAEPVAWMVEDITHRNKPAWFTRHKEESDHQRTFPDRVRVVPLYIGAREDMQLWKKRALAAEAKLGASAEGLDKEAVLKLLKTTEYAPETHQFLKWDIQRIERGEFDIKGVQSER